MLAVTEKFPTEFKPMLDDDDADACADADADADDNADDVCADADADDGGGDGSDNDDDDEDDGAADANDDDADADADADDGGGDGSAVSRIVCTGRLCSTASSTRCFFLAGCSALLPLGCSTWLFHQGTDFSFLPMSSRPMPCSTKMAADDDDDDAADDDDCYDDEDQSVSQSVNHVYLDY